MNIHMPNRWKGIRPFKRHSLVLMVAGLVYILIGISYISTKPTHSRYVALKVALDWMSIDKWGYVFIIAGALAIISSRWPPISETWGYTVLTGLSTGWGSFYLVTVLFEHSPAQNLSGFLTWGIIGFMWWAISGLTNPHIMTVLPPREPNQIILDSDQHLYPPVKEE